MNRIKHKSSGADFCIFIVLQSSIQRRHNEPNKEKKNN